MRITIEDSDVRMAAAATTSATPSTAGPAIDAGPPAASLLQSLFSSATVEGNDAGAPSEFLMQALQGTSSMSYAGETSNAGAAPVV